jgi:hypothetical protein
MFLHLDFYYLCSHMFRSSCSMECLDHMFYVVNDCDLHHLHHLDHLPCGKVEVFC